MARRYHPRSYAVYLQRMELQSPKDVGERLNARLLRLALARTA